MFTVRALLVTAGTIFSEGLQCGYYSREGTIHERLLLEIFQCQPQKGPNTPKYGNLEPQIRRKCGYNSRAGTIQEQICQSRGAGTIRERLLFKSGY